MIEKRLNRDGNTTSVVLQPPLQNGVIDDVDASGQPEFPHRVRFVGFDCFHTERELAGDFLVAVARRNQTQHFRLALAGGSARLGQATSFATEAYDRNTSRC